MATCFVCGGTGGDPEAHVTCWACNGSGAVGVLEQQPPRDVPTETFRVTGKATERVVVVWGAGIADTHVSRPSAPEGP